MDDSQGVLGTPLINDDLLQNFKDAGMYEFAAEVDFFKTNQLPPSRGRDAGSGGRMGAFYLTPEKRASPTGAPFPSPDPPQKRKASQDTPGSAGTTEETPSKKKKRVARGTVADKNGKGLRHFSNLVCEKVKERGRTTYNEVAEDLVMQFKQMQNEDSKEVFDEKNIRRRVYDALNVLMALKIIVKEKKEITWRGYPESPEANHVEQLRMDQGEQRKGIELKKKYLAELTGQYNSMMNLVKRNMHRDLKGSKIALPFILVRTNPKSNVEVNMSKENRVCHIDFHGSTFEIHDDNYVLSEMGLDKMTFPEVEDLQQPRYDVKPYDVKPSVKRASSSSQEAPNQQSKYSGSRAQ